MDLLGWKASASHYHDFFFEMGATNVGKNKQRINNMKNEKNKQRLIIILSPALTLVS